MLPTDKMNVDRWEILKWYVGSTEPRKVISVLSCACKLFVLWKQVITSCVRASYYRDYNLYAKVFFVKVFQDRLLTMLEEIWCIGITSKYVANEASRVALAECWRDCSISMWRSQHSIRFTFWRFLFQSRCLLDMCTLNLCINYFVPDLSHERIVRYAHRGHMLLLCKLLHTYKGTYAYVGLDVFL